MLFLFVFLKPLKWEQTCHQTLWSISGSGNQSKQQYFPPASSSPTRKASLFCQKRTRGWSSLSSRYKETDLTEIKSPPKCTSASMKISFLSWRPSSSSQEPVATLRRTSGPTCSTWNTSTRTVQHQMPTSSLPKATKTTCSLLSRWGSLLFVYMPWLHLLIRHETDFFFPSSQSHSWTTWSLRRMKYLRRIPLNILSTNR